MRKIEEALTSLQITLKTRNDLKALGKKGEAYEDIIRGILIENDKLKKEIRQLKKQQLVAENKIAFKKYERVTGAIMPEKKTIISFTYNAINNINDEEYQMGIRLKEIIHNGRRINKGKYFKNKKSYMRAYLKMVEQVIRTEINPVFKLRKNENILDYETWKRVFERNGLPKNSYHEDIEIPLMKYEQEG